MVFKRSAFPRPKNVILVDILKQLTEAAVGITILYITATWFGANHDALLQWPEQPTRWLWLSLLVAGIYFLFILTAYLTYLLRNTQSGGEGGIWPPDAPPPFQDFLSARSDYRYPAVVLFLSVTAAFPEELLFRAVLKGLQGGYMVIGILVSSFVFSLVHILDPQPCISPSRLLGAASKAIRNNPKQFWKRLVAGCTYGVALASTGSLLVPIALHATNNIMIYGIGWLVAGIDRHAQR